MTNPTNEVVISVDSHITEPEELWDRLPEEMQCYRSTDEVLPDGSERSSVEGARTLGFPGSTPSAKTISTASIAATNRAPGI